MTPGLLSGLPVSAQFFIYGIFGFGIAAGLIASYFKGKQKEAPTSSSAVTVFSDPAATTRIVEAMDRLDRSLDRSTDAVRDSTEISAKLYRAITAHAASLPRDEEIVKLLQQLMRKTPE